MSACCYSRQQQFLFLSLLVFNLFAINTYAQKKSKTHAKPIAYEYFKITKLNVKDDSLKYVDTNLFYIELKFKSTDIDTVYIPQFGKFSTKSSIAFLTTTKKLNVSNKNATSVLKSEYIANASLLMAPISYFIPNPEEFPGIARTEKISNSKGFDETVRTTLNAFFELGGIRKENNHLVTIYTTFKQLPVEKNCPIGYYAIKIQYEYPLFNNPYYDISFLAKESKAKDSELRPAGGIVKKWAIDKMLEIIKFLSK